MRTPLLELNLLQTLAAVHEAGTLARAADRVNRTQSAVSLQVQRLEAIVGVELFSRAGRALRLNPAGEALVAYAERMLELNGEAVAAVRGRTVSGSVRLGMSVDFEHTWLPKAMARFATTHPRIQVELRVDRNSSLQQAVARRELDIALIFDDVSRRKAALGVTRMEWIASPAFTWDRSAEIPLLLLEHPCMFRTAAIKALDDAGIGWRLAVSSPSMGGIWATASACMGVTVRSAAAIPEGLVAVGAKLGLPALPEVGISVIEAATRGSAPRATLRSVLHELVEELLLRGV